MLKFRFSLPNLLISLALFALLLFIAIYVRDSFVRPFLGDVIAVIWLYFSFKTWLDVKPLILSLFVLLIAFLLEFLQYIHIVDILGLSHITVIRIVLGSTYDSHDLLAYSLGWATIFVIEMMSRKGQR